MHVIPLGMPEVTGVYWWVVTDGPQPAKLTSGDEVDNFFHFAAVYGRSEGGEWSEVDRLEIESAPQRTQVELLTTGWEAPDGEPSAWIAVRGGTGAHAGTLDVIGFDGTTVSTALSRITQRQYLSEFLDLDGDGLLEVVLNDSDPYIFCFVCATELQRVVLYRWTGAQLERVELGTPPDQSDDQIERAVALAKADLWREAAAAAVDASRAFPESAEVRWLSILINWTAVARLNYGGASGQPLLTQVFAGEYAAAADLMRALEPAQAFALDGPLIAGTAAEQDLSTMAVQLLDYTERALAVAPDRADIHAVRALGLALASPDDLSAARSALAQAATLAPDDAFFEASRDFLESVERAPGAPIEPPDQEYLALLEGPSASFFAEGYTLGSGDRGRNVKAVQQRSGADPGAGLRGPGTLFRRLPRTDPESRGGVPVGTGAGAKRRGGRRNLGGAGSGPPSCVGRQPGHARAANRRDRSSTAGLSRLLQPRCAPSTTGGPDRASAAACLRRFRAAAGSCRGGAVGGLPDL